MPKPLDWTPELVGRFWSGVANTRLREMAFARLAGDSLVDLLKDYLDPEARCLDYGGGQGELVEKLLARGFETALYEPSSDRALLLPSGVEDHPKFLGQIHGDSDETFDVVMLVEVIEHVLEAELDESLQRIRGMIRPGGTLVITTPNSEDLILGSSYCPNCDSIFHRWQHQRAFTPESLTALLDKYGFERRYLHQVDFSGNGERNLELKQLRREIKELTKSAQRVQKAVGLWPALRRMLRRRKAPALELPVRPEIERRPEGDLRIGSGNNLVYIGTRR